MFSCETAIVCLVNYFTDGLGEEYISHIDQRTSGNFSLLIHDLKCNLIHGPLIDRRYLVDVAEPKDFSQILQCLFHDVPYNHWNKFFLIALYHLDLSSKICAFARIKYTIEVIKLIKALDLTKSIESEEGWKSYVKLKTIYHG